MPLCFEGCFERGSIMSEQVLFSKIVGFFVSLLAGGQGLAIQPSLANFNFDFSDASLLKIENFSINIKNVLNEQDNTAPLPLTLVDSKGNEVDLSITEATVDSQDHKEQESEEAVAVHYRLAPHFIFDTRSGKLGEFEIAFRVRVIVMPKDHSVAFTLFDAMGTKQTLFIDPENNSKPVAIESGIQRIPFNTRGRLVQGSNKKIRWSFRRFPLSSANRIGEKNTAADSILVTVEEDAYEAAWWLIRQDLSREDLYPQHFLLLIRRALGDGNE